MAATDKASLIASGRIMRFAELPQTAQDALIHYMSVDGAAWAVAAHWPDWRWGGDKPGDLLTRAEVMVDISVFRQRFVDSWGDVEFGYAEVPVAELHELIKLDDDYYVGNADGRDNSEEYATPTWPVILSDFPGETLQDGWNRFYRYLAMDMPVPVVWYTD